MRKDEHAVHAEGSWFHARTMSTFGVDLPFVGSKALPFDFYEPLLSWILERPEFRQWLLPNCAWQLRLIGGPGSGKVCLQIKHSEQE